MGRRLGERHVPPPGLHRRGEREGPRPRRRLDRGPQGRRSRPALPARAVRRAPAPVPADARRRLPPPGRRGPGVHLHRGDAGHRRHARARPRLRRRGGLPPRRHATASTRAASTARSATGRASPSGCARSRRPAAWISTRRGPTRTRSPICRCCARSGTRGREPRPRARARGPRERLGDHALRDARPAPEGRRRRDAPRPRPPAAPHASASRRPADVRGPHRPSSARSATSRGRFSDEIVAPRAADWDREKRFPREVANQLGELGLMGVCVPEDLGGAGADFVSYVLVIEEISRGDAGLGVTLAVHTSAGTLPIVTYGTRDQAERVVPPLAQGHELARSRSPSPEPGRTRPPSARGPRTGASPARSSGSRTAGTRTASSSSPATRTTGSRPTSRGAARRAWRSRARRTRWACTPPRPPT